MVQAAQLGFVAQRSKLVGLRPRQGQDERLGVDKVVGQMRVVQRAPGQAQGIFERGVDKAHTALALHHGHWRGQQVKGLESVGRVHGMRTLVCTERRASSRCRLSMSRSVRSMAAFISATRSRYFWWLRVSEAHFSGSPRL